MKQSGHLNPSEETGAGGNRSWRKPELDAPLLKSMEGHLQASMEVWVDNNHMVETYSSMDLVMALYVEMFVSINYICCVVVDLPLLRVAVEGSDNPITLEQPCQASLPPD